MISDEILNGFVLEYMFCFICVWGSVNDWIIGKCFVHLVRLYDQFLLMFHCDFSMIYIVFE